MLSRVLAVVALAAGCGRVGFAELTDAPPGAGTDASDAADDIDSALPVTCPPAYTHVAGTSRYRAGGPSDDWILGEQDCEADGAGIHLAIVQSAAEMGALVPIAGIEVWWGVTDRITQETWREVTGGLATFLPWEAGNPAPGPEDCVYWIPATGEIRNQSCTSGRTWICECDGAEVDPTSY